MLDEIEDDNNPVDTGGETDWPDHWDKRDQVRAVARTLSQPRDAAWIAKRADVTEKTARKHLNRLADDQVLRTDISDNGRKLYELDPRTQVFDHLRELSERDDATLSDELDRIAAEINEWRSEFDVDTPTELRASIDETMSPAERERRLDAASNWEHNLQSRTLIRIALRTGAEIDAVVRTYDSSEAPVP